MASSTQSSMNESATRRVAVLLPCLDEEITIGKVIRDFRLALPHADIYVFDNNSSDDTAKVAAAAGAIVVHSSAPGKGNVVKHMFRVVDADVYVLADGDDTYPAEVAGELVEALDRFDVDMVVGTRLRSHDKKSFRILHQFGNKFVSKMISLLFSATVTDVLSGYRVMSKHLVHMIYLRSSGFEVETELTLQSLVKNRAIKEIPVHYGNRPTGSVSKLNTFSDGIYIFKAVFLVFKDYKPLVFFTILSGLCFVFGLFAGWYPISDYVASGYVYHLPLALLAAALEILAVLFFGIGLILNSIRSFHVESQELVGNLYKLLSKQPRD